MSLLREMSVFSAEVRRLHGAWRELDVTAAEDRPRGDGLAAADRITEVVTEGRGDLAEAQELLAGPATTRALWEAARLLDRVRRCYYEELCSFGAVAAMLRAVRGITEAERRREWQAWAQGLRAGVDRCAAVLRAVDAALLRCLGELADAGADDAVVSY
ncbi:hypothetical protein [Streptomyces sp. NPDC001401]|uniref:hypothetical protein n=1 Tax=Streptomyces sp. NPDC001401 TaxID=3364570 RepID=UPI00369F12B9